jgi:SAM-dependent methyltransferase
MKTASPYFGPISMLASTDLPNVMHTSLYEGFFARFYAAMAEAFTGDLTWFSNRLPPDSDVLELCCGSGRLAVAVASAGHRVVGVDNAEAMVARARERLASAPAEVRQRVAFEKADALTLNRPSRFDAVILTGLSVSTFRTAADRAALFLVAARHLRRGGVLMFDYLPGGTQAPPEEFTALPAAIAGESGFVLVGVQRDHIAGEQRANFYAELVDGQSTRRLFTHHRLAVLDSAALHGELAACGLTVLLDEQLSPTQLLALAGGSAPSPSNPDPHRIGLVVVRPSHDETVRQDPT